MKYQLLIAVALAAISCNRQKSETSVKVNDPAEIITPVPPSDNALTIVPGVSIGKIVIGNNAETLSMLGKPDFSDSAMGKSWLVWYGDDKDEKSRETQLMAYTTYKDQDLREKSISELRINSGEFKTQTGIGAGTNFEVIKKEFPKLAQVAKYRNQRTGKDIFIYDAEGAGIAFEFVSYEGDYAKCTAVIVYSKDKKLNTDYIMNLPERSLPGGE